jgi:hypothetical protein
MIFLLDYDRKEGRLRCITDDGERGRAQEARLNGELALNGANVDREIILLEAVDEATLRRTHRRYFEDLSQLAEAPK